MDLIPASYNVVRVENIWGNLYSVPLEVSEIFVRVKRIVLHRHPKLLYTSLLEWELEYWEREADIGVVAPRPVLGIDSNGTIVRVFTMDITITPKGPDGLGVLYASIRVQLENNFGSICNPSRSRSFTYTETVNSPPISDTSYLVLSGTNNRHVTAYTHQGLYELDGEGSLVQTFDGMLLSIENEGNLLVPIPFNYKGIDLLYSALRVLYQSTPITVKAVKNNQVI